MQSVHRNVFKACTCAHTVVTGLHKYIWTIAQIQMCNCTNTRVLSSAVGQGSLAGNTGFVQASLHLQYVDAQEMHTYRVFFFTGPALKVLSVEDDKIPTKKVKVRVCHRENVKI